MLLCLSSIRKKKADDNESKKPALSNFHRLVVFGIWKANWILSSQGSGWNQCRHIGLNYSLATGSASNGIWNCLLKQTSTCSRMPPVPFDEDLSPETRVNDIFKVTHSISISKLKSIIIALQLTLAYQSLDEQQEVLKEHLARPNVYTPCLHIYQTKGLTPKEAIWCPILHATPSEFFIEKFTASSIIK